MSPAEVLWRIEDRVRQEAWAHRSFPAPVTSKGARTFAALPATLEWSQLGDQARNDVIAAADKVAEGRWDFFGELRFDMVDPDWSLDPVSAQSYPSDRPAFRIDYRAPGDPRHIKQVWELSRHHHLTVLAAAWRLSGEDRYAELIDAQLRSWWRANPVATGVNWASGIEVGIRLISWVWVRRLLDGWSGTAALFEHNVTAIRQIYWHQRFLATFESRGSSANNHVVAEAAGLVVASCAFGWFDESPQWRADGIELLERELAANTFPSGLNREQAFEYHGLVIELGLCAAVEAHAARSPLSVPTWERLCTMVDAMAAVLDVAGEPPRFGDGDDGRALIVADPHANRWSSLLALGAALFGPAPWWPRVPAPDVQSLALGAMAGGPLEVAGREPTRRSHFGDAGLTILRTPRGDRQSELWCRLRGGPHGFLSIAAHAHADALSLELRCGGVEILSDPGTYCYHGEPEWRRYFRSTLAHNTLELDGEDQSVSGGPFLWIDQASTHLGRVDVDGAHQQRWSAEHDGYERLSVPARHRRSVELDPVARSVSILDQLLTSGDHDVRLAFHLGPTVQVVLTENRATLIWPDYSGATSGATMHLAEQLTWTAHQGEVDPPLGWYSPGFGRRVPTTTLIGSARLGATELATRIDFGG